MIKTSHVPRTLLYTSHFLSTKRETAQRSASSVWSHLLPLSNMSVACPTS